MSVCNLFRELKKDTGNFLSFSQYADDLTRYYVQHNDYKAIPSRFIVCNLNCSGLTNVSLPTKLQNEFENACAYFRSLDGDNYTPETAKNIFWSVFGDMLGGLKEESSEDITYKYFDAIKYIGDINIQSYEEKDGVGYNEIYCYIPNDAHCTQYEVVEKSLENTITYPYECVMGYERSDIINGMLDITIPSKTTYSRECKYQLYHKGLDSNISTLLPHTTNDRKFEFNTVVILYDIMSKNSNGDETIKYKDIPLGIFFTGTIIGEESQPNAPITHGTQGTNTTIWHDEGNPNDVWMAISSKDTRGWSEWSISKIKDEKEENGKAGQSTLVSTVFIAATSKPQTPTGGSFSSPIPEGWSDGIPERTTVNSTIYMSRRMFTSDGVEQDSVWSDPIIVYNSQSTNICFHPITYGVMSNSITKYVENDDIYGAGTSYGIRICTRFTSTPNATEIREVSIESSNQYAGFVQVMEACGQTISETRKLLSTLNTNENNIKQHLSTFKNYRTNIPYVRYINSTPYWFVNGKNTGVKLTYELTEEDKEMIVEEVYNRVQDRLNSSVDTKIDSISTMTQDSIVNMFN